MVDGITGPVCDQIALADIGEVALILILREEMIEWLIARRANILGNGFIPFFAIGKDRVDIEDDSSKIEHAVPDNVANTKAGSGLAWRVDRAACLIGEELRSFHSPEDMAFRICKTTVIRPVS